MSLPLSVSTPDARPRAADRVLPVTSKAIKTGERMGTREGVALAVVGLEAEFVVIMDGQPVKPEDVFGSPRRLIRGPMMHRVGRSYHLPTGSAIYFDTGVVEIATPAMELARGCAARAGRSLWESIRFLRSELDAWELRTDRSVQLGGFSTHYNISFEIPHAARGTERTVHRLAFLLTHILPVPVMLLGANRRSTGIGARPRLNRIEITADFTPDAALMIATATLVTGIVREAMRWSSFDLEQLAKHDIPVIAGFVPERHSSRSGWVARHSSYPKNPFVSDIDAAEWRLTGGEVVSLREIGRRIVDRFGSGIERYADPRSLCVIRAVIQGERQSLLQLPDRPASYESVGHLCTWADLFPVRALPRSRYERVLIRAISGKPLVLDGRSYKPVKMDGWSHVVFERQEDASRHRFSLDFLLKHLRNWGLTRRTESRLRNKLRRRLEGRYTGHTRTSTSGKKPPTRGSSS